MCFSSLWAGPYSGDMKTVLLAGADSMFNTAMKIVRRQKKGDMLMIDGGHEEEDTEDEDEGDDYAS